VHFSSKLKYAASSGVRLHQLHSNEIHGDNWKVWSKVIIGCGLPLIFFSQVGTYAIGVYDVRTGCLVLNNNNVGQPISQNDHLRTV
jgi:hypothetical protein